jgi:hypothetical protein
MDEADVRLGQQAGATAEAARDAADWIGRNAAGIGEGSPELRRVFHRFARAARQYESATIRPMCVAVFGPSQVGKSYLVSALARKPTANGSPPPLMAVFANRKVDFLKEINPEEEQEATGLVTRFSIVPNTGTAVRPAVVRLLDQLDLVKILANTYFHDFEAAQEQVPLEPEVKQALEQASKQTQGSTNDDIDVDDLHVYFDAQFPARETTKLLNRIGYWERLEALASALPIAERVKLYSFLWGQLPEFNELYLRLYTDLKGLGFSREAHCPIEALIPREKSIINVKALGNIAGDDTDKLEVNGGAAAPYAIARSHLTAITAELLIQIAEEPWPFFQHTDLLDFPGARSREMINEPPAAYVKKPGAIAGLFRRGKVAYLFDRYRERKELTSMLLCVVPGNQDVMTLPRTVLSWIHDSHGISPEERSRVETALLFVMTKFDRRFETSKGKPLTSHERWSGAIATALTGYFGPKSSDDWTRFWRPDVPFNNCYWLRNPNFHAPGLMRYSPDRAAEVGLLEPERIEEIKREYLDNEAIQRHFGGTERALRAWNAAFTPNDGGIRYLAESLEPVCRPELKRRQIEERLRGLRRQMREKLEEFHVSDDNEAEKKKRIKAAEQAVDALNGLVNARRFGHFLSELQVASDALELLFQRTKLTGNIGAFAAEKSAGDGESDWFSQMLQSGGIESKQDGSKKAPEPGSDYVSLASASVEHWAARLRALPQNERVLDFLRVKQSTVETVVRELLAGGERLKLRERIAQGIEVVTPMIEPGQTEMVKPALVSAESLNRYVWMLGQDDLETSQRAKSPRGNQMVAAFQKAAPIDKLEGLPNKEQGYQRDFVADWVFSFVALAKRNADDGIQRRFSGEESSALGAILGRLGGAEERVNR